MNNLLNNIWIYLNLVIYFLIIIKKNSYNIYIFVIIASINFHYFVYVSWYYSIQQCPPFFVCSVTEIKNTLADVKWMISHS